MSLDPTSPPENLGFCAQCMCWQVAQAIDVFTLPDGRSVPVDHPMAKDIPIAQRTRLRIAACTLMPQWLMKSAGDWCQQWRARK